MVCSMLPIAVAWSHNRVVSGQPVPISQGDSTWINQNLQVCNSRISCQELLNIEYGYGVAVRYGYLRLQGALGLAY